VTDLSTQAKQVLDSLADEFSAVILDWEIKQRADGPYLLIYVTHPAERFFAALQRALLKIPEANVFLDRSAIVRRPKASSDRIRLPETRVLLATITSSLTVDRHTFEEDFFGRFIPSVHNLEQQIVVNHNVLVYGRRGSGKSTLLAYAMHTTKRAGGTFAWIPMQAYEGRADSTVCLEVFRELLTQMSIHEAQRGIAEGCTADLARVKSQSDQIVDKALDQITPRIRAWLGEIARGAGSATIFLDDLHLVQESLQPRLLARIYSLTRGNRSFIKASGIEQFTHPWEPRARKGLEPTHDARILKLDYNLTVPHKSREHIVAILDARARDSGLPSVQYVTGNGVLERLVWVAAAVPRDALSLFASAVSKGSMRGEKRLSVASVNVAASEMAEEKLRALDADAGKEAAHIRELLERVRDFCVSEHRRNAFLVEIKNQNSVFRRMQELVALRLVHVLHEAITPHKAGQRFMALMLDYGFYVGIRAARSVDLFQRQPGALSAKDVRKLPIFPLVEKQEASAPT
jgi:hypothetical protein